MRAIIGFCWPKTSQSEAVRQHAENDRGVAAAGRLANQDRKQTSARKPSSGEASAARQTGAGTTPKGPARLAVDTTGAGGYAFGLRGSSKRKFRLCLESK